MANKVKNNCLAAMCLCGREAERRRPDLHTTAVYSDLWAMTSRGGSVSDYRMAEDALRLSFGQVRKAAEGDDTTFAAEATRVGRRYTPGTFYTKLAVDRLLWDQIQTLVDPDYRASFRRMEQRTEKDSGQGFWFRPGSVTPERAPDLGNVVPAR